MSEDFPRQLIKGKITEQIFELMFRESGEFNVFRFGYEFTEEYLAQHQNEVEFKKVLNPISSSPDFLLVKQDNTQVYMVEVKYRHQMREEELLEIATTMVKRWDHAYLFVASPSGFFFSPANTIIGSMGAIEPLAHTWATAELQDRYLRLLNEFIQTR